MKKIFFLFYHVIQKLLIPSFQNCTHILNFSQRLNYVTFCSFRLSSCQQTGSSFQNIPFNFVRIFKSVDKISYFLLIRLHLIPFTSQLALLPWRGARVREGHAIIKQTTMPLSVLFVGTYSQYLILQPFSRACRLFVSPSNT